MTSKLTLRVSTCSASAWVVQPRRSLFTGYRLSISFLMSLSTLIPSSRYRPSLALAAAPEVRPPDTDRKQDLRSRSALTRRIPCRYLNAFSLQYGLQYFESLRVTAYMVPQVSHGRCLVFM